MVKGGGCRGNRRFPYYKMVPRMEIELNGLFFPNSRPLPLDGLPAFFFLTPIPIGFSHVPIKGGERYG